MFHSQWSKNVFYKDFENFNHSENNRFFCCSSYFIVINQPKSISIFRLCCHLIWSIDQCLPNYVYKLPVAKHVQIHQFNGGTNIYYCILTFFAFLNTLSVKEKRFLAFEYLIFWVLLRYCPATFSSVCLFASHSFFYHLLYVFSVHLVLAIMKYLIVRSLLGYFSSLFLLVLHTSSS